jgi:hypothetical protein
LNLLIPQSGISTLEKKPAERGKLENIFRLMILLVENKPAFY